MPLEKDWYTAQRDRIFFTWSAQQNVRGFEIVDAEGPRFKVAGQGWMWDLQSQTYNVCAGHRHPQIVARMIEQIQTLPAAHPHALLPVRMELAQLLHLHTGMHKAFFTTGGSEAVENAIKIARLVTGRSKIITRRTSYHGATLAVLGIAGDQRKKPFERDLANAFHIEDPYPAREADGEKCSDWLESLTHLIERENPETIAAILLEGMTGVNGMQTPPRDFWPGARKLCNDYGILLIDDEIFSGFGRTGKWWAWQHWGAAPDILVLGKGLTSGYGPMGAALVTEKIARHFDDKILWCGLTNFAHPVSCAAAVATLRVLENEKLVENAARVGEALRRRLLALNSGPGGAKIRDIRGKGLMQAIVFDRPSATFLELLWERGVFAPGAADMMFICPPLCLSEAQMNEIMDIVESALGTWN
ncbi:MAG TPA: aspartate aminotransferase family protein [Candidatus Angelobacter sp.]